MLFFQDTKEEMSKNRIEALLDGLFAIAMTILVLNITVPTTVKISESGDLFNALRTMIPTFLNYIISFAILAALWVNDNHQFHYIKQTERTYLWLCLWNLMFIILIPFSTSLLGDYHGLIAAELFFHLNLLCVGIFSIIRWNYIFRNRHLLQEDSCDISIIAKERRVNSVFIIVPLIAICVAFIVPGWSALSYILILPIASLLRKIAISPSDMSQV